MFQDIRQGAAIQFIETEIKVKAGSVFGQEGHRTVINFTAQSRQPDFSEALPGNTGAVIRSFNNLQKGKLADDADKKEDQHKLEQQVTQLGSKAFILFRFKSHDLSTGNNHFGISGIHQEFPEHDKQDTA